MKKVQENISLFMIHSYIYYVLGKSVITDAEYDKICSDLIENYNLVTSSSHPHKEYITMDRLKSTTAYDIKIWPTIVKHNAQLMLHEP